MVFCLGDAAPDQLYLLELGINNLALLGSEIINRLI
jgi:hypothetical protein